MDTILSTDRAAGKFLPDLFFQKTPPHRRGKKLYGAADFPVDMSYRCRII